MRTPARSSAHRRLLAGGLVLALALGAALSLRAVAGSSDHELARQALERGEVLPLTSVLAKVEHDYPGQPLKIEFEREHGRFIYEIRLLQPDGRIVKLRVNAVNGQMISVRRKDDD